MAPFCVILQAGISLLIVNEHIQSLATLQEISIENLINIKNITAQYLNHNQEEEDEDEASHNNLTYLSSIDKRLSDTIRVKRVAEQEQSLLINTTRLPYDKQESKKNQLENEGQSTTTTTTTQEQQAQTTDTPEYMQHMTAILVTLHVSVFVTGLVGNSLVCLSVYRNKSLQTITNYYIVNLAVADFLVILICLPPTVYWDLTLTWNFGLIPCKLVLYLQSISVSVSVLTLTCISIDRWCAICRPLKFGSTKRRARRTIALIWFASALIASPDVIYLTTRPMYEEDDRVYFDCTYSWPEQVTKMYQLCIVTLLFVLPFVFMTISYAHIVHVLWRNETMTETMQHALEHDERRHRAAAAALVEQQSHLSKQHTVVDAQQEFSQWNNCQVDGKLTNEQVSGCKTSGVFNDKQQEKKCAAQMKLIVEMAPRYESNANPSCLTSETQQQQHRVDLKDLKLATPLGIDAHDGDNDNQCDDEEAKGGDKRAAAAARRRRVGWQKRRTFLGGSVSQRLEECNQNQERPSLISCMSRASVGGGGGNCTAIARKQDNDDDQDDATKLTNNNAKTTARGELITQLERVFGCQQTTRTQAAATRSRSLTSIFNFDNKGGASKVAASSSSSQARPSRLEQGVSIGGRRGRRRTKACTSSHDDDEQWRTPSLRTQTTSAASRTTTRPRPVAQPLPSNLSAPSTANCTQRRRLSMFRDEFEERELKAAAAAATQCQSERLVNLRKCYECFRVTPAPNNKPKSARHRRQRRAWWPPPPFLWATNSCVTTRSASLSSIALSDSGVSSLECACVHVANANHQNAISVVRCNKQCAATTRHQLKGIKLNRQQEEKLFCAAPNHRRKSTQHQNDNTHHLTIDSSTCSSSASSSSSASQLSLQQQQQQRRKLKIWLPLNMTNHLISERNECDQATTTTTAKQQQSAHLTSAPPPTNTRFCKLIESRKKAAKMLIVIVIMFGLCYLPIHFLNTLRYTIGLPQNDAMTIASLVSHWLCYFNSAVNPLIYNLMSGKFRHEFANLFFCRCFRRSTAATTAMKTTTATRKTTTTTAANKIVSPPGNNKC